MKLKKYLEQIGDAAAAEKFNVTPRAIASWRRGERTPRGKQAAIIVQSSPVTYEGIYGLVDADQQKATKRQLNNSR